jgi:hypothetical protein
MVEATATPQLGIASYLPAIPRNSRQIMDRIAERFKRLGGMTPALEKKIGF